MLFKTGHRINSFLSSRTFLDKNKWKKVLHDVSRHVIILVSNSRKRKRNQLPPSEEEGWKSPSIGHRAITEDSRNSKSCDANFAHMDRPSFQPSQNAHATRLVASYARELGTITKNNLRGITFRWTFQLKITPITTTPSAPNVLYFITILLPRCK